MKAATIRLYENVTSKLKNKHGFLKEIKCDIRAKHGCPLSPTIFGIYIDKIEGCLEEEGCVGMVLVGIVLILLLYADNVVLIARCPTNLDKELRLLKYFFSTMDMMANTHKTKFMIIKSKKYIYANFMYNNSNLE